MGSPKWGAFFRGEGAKGPVFLPFFLIKSGAYKREAF